MNDEHFPGPRSRKERDRDHACVASPPRRIPQTENAEDQLTIYGQRTLLDCILGVLDRKPTPTTIPLDAVKDKC